MAAGRAILATRVDRWASGALTRCDDALVYGAATFRDFLVDALQASGVSRAAAQSQVRMALKQAPRLLSVDCAFSFAPRRQARFPFQAMLDQQVKHIVNPSLNPSWH